MRISDWSSDVCSSDLAIYHYEKPEINDNLSSLTFDIFMKNLDNNRSFFLESDIQEFEKYRNTLDDAMKSGELAAPYDIFNTYTERFNETKIGRARLNSSH